MNYFYSASVMGYGDGRIWHKYYDFNSFDRVTKTITIKPNIGIPFAIVKFGNTLWNRVGLHNIGFDKFCSSVLSKSKNTSKMIVSLSGIDYDIYTMVNKLNDLNINIAGIELNFSCPNARDNHNNLTLYRSKYPVYLKLNYLQDPYDYDLDYISGIRLNAVPTFIGALSGAAAKKHNWKFIKKFSREGLNVAGCSFNTMDDIKELEGMGCTEIGIGSTILTNPDLITNLTY